MPPLRLSQNQYQINTYNLILETKYCFSMSLETQQQENKVGKFAPNLGIANIQNILIN